MERLTTKKDVSEMGMFELAHNSCYAKDGKARYRDYDLDIDARELTKKLLKDHAGGDDSFTDDEDFDDWMMDYLQDGMDSIEGLIALFYRNLWAMADLRERLAEYEDLEERCCKENSWGLKMLTEKWKEFIEDIQELYEYRKAEEQNRLLKLPCAVGDMVWFIKSNFSYMKNPKGEKVRKIEIIDLEIIFRTENRCFEMKYIGKTVFLTREEAEAALKELERGKGE